MTIEDVLRASLAERLDSLETPPGDLAAALREGGQDRRRRPLLVGVAAACLAVVVATGVALAQRDGSERLDPAPAPSSGEWTRLPQAPLSPRANALTVWTGEEVLVLGGEVDHLCPPNAGCVRRPTVARDGAAYDPGSKTWRTIAPPPVDLAGWLPTAVVGDRLIVAAAIPALRRGGDATLLEYDVSDDAWRELPWGVPLEEGLTNPLSVLDGKLYLRGHGSGVVVLDLTTGARTALPASPHQPPLRTDHVLPTPEGIVVIGPDSTAPNDGRAPTWAFAEVYDGRSWRRLPRADMTVGYSWHWSGERLVAPDLQCVDGGEVNPYGSCVPEGGTLDPSTGRWGPLPHAPDLDDGPGGWSLSAREGPLMAGWGYVYDDRDESWTAIPRPGGAPEHVAGAVFGDGTLFAFGGVTWDRKPELSGDAWAWTP